MKQLVVITGLSGSGKSLAAKCLEDLGFFCVDNLPVGLIPPFYELMQRSGEQVRSGALVVDAREGVFLEAFPDTLSELRRRNIPVQVLFFDCADDVLKRRFSETRRPHPMARASGTLEQAIEDERVALAPLRDVADRVIDTSAYTPHQLRHFLQNAYSPSEDSGSPNVNVMSFGFKYGVPREADLLFDVRFLPNPYFVEELRPLDGRTAEVQEFLDRNEMTHEFSKRLHEFLEYLIPLYAAEGKAYLTVAVGCTGGKHRSVALAERAGHHLGQHELPVSVSHRDVGRE
ncbi:MAG: RNase adapter RapZ [bacterium]|nr:RNase adapter RapZ [bacterium]